MRGQPTKPTPTPGDTGRRDAMRLQRSFARPTWAGEADVACMAGLVALLPGERKHDLSARENGSAQCSVLSAQCSDGLCPNSEPVRQLGMV